MTSSLELSWPLLLAALVLLWTPLGLLVGGKLRRKLSFPDRNERVRLRHVLQSGWSWLDLLRTFGGAYLLTEWAVRTPVAPEAHGWPALLVKVAVLAIGVTLQVFVTGRRWLHLAPLFYLLGLAAAVAPWPVALFGGLLALAMSGLVDWFGAVLLLLPPCLIATAYFFGGLAPLPLLPAGFSLGLAAYSFIARRPLVWVASRVR